MDASYVPNNPQFGLQFECNWSNGTLQQVTNNNITGIGATQGGTATAAAGTTGTSGTTEDRWSDCWSDDMGSFSLPLDLEPLPTLFNISPTCANSQLAPTTTTYKTEPCGTFQTQPPLIFRENKQPGDVADVLLSLKHAVVHPDQTSRQSDHQQLHQQLQQQQQQQQHHQHQQLYHPQMLLSPAGGGGYCDQPFPQQMFPSMSVNVSMNMTMHGYHPNSHGYHPAADISCPQVQWSATPQTANSSQYSAGSGLLSPAYGGTTYSFTADFRPPQDTPVLAASSYKPVQMSFSSPRRRHSITLMDDECQKPNVCRICGKSYARPSTLKTHLRTHSGEKPYRCVDCNKSFSQAANLTAHVRTHSGEKPFRCPVCDRRFSQSSSVTTHMRTHSGERPYRCRLCKKAFSDSSTLTKHLRIHSGEKPYECKLCLLRFSQSGNLNRHMRVHGTGAAAGNGMPP
ncbi:protein glass isoform X2 [Aethina tumida]|uniref:protein glass isoform X2 n=1 Tax=Aethina tumida TaxID=116153 RepID=UPI002148EE40|nr:protein glass isoform X2 [Aethina tumida]